MATGWVIPDGKWRYMNGSGILSKGWIYDGSNWYYMDQNGVMQTGWLDDRGQKYFLKENKSNTQQLVGVGAALGIGRDLGWERLPGVYGVALAETPSSRDMEPEVATSCTQAGTPVEG